MRLYDQIGGDEKERVVRASFVNQKVSLKNPLIKKKSKELNPDFT